MKNLYPYLKEDPLYETRHLSAQKPDIRWSLRLLRLHLKILCPHLQSFFATWELSEHWLKHLFLLK